MIEQRLVEKTAEGLLSLYDARAEEGQLTVQKTRSEFEGDFTIVVFPLLRHSKKGPEQTATELGNFLVTQLDEVASFNVIKGFLNLSLHDSFWLNFLDSHAEESGYGLQAKSDRSPIVIEFSSPNTNKPLHLGHVRNNLIGWSVSRILEASGYPVEKVNLVNDRGIHICKTMLAWQRWGEGIDPSKTGAKGDKLVGQLYVKFEAAHKQQVLSLIEEGMQEDEAVKSTALIREANELLRKWEAGDDETRTLWKRMNDWVYEGFDGTYDRMGVSFDKIYYESETYKKGKALVQEGLDKGICFTREDGSVWIDLTDKGLDEKLLLRNDGTSVYMTQDLGTAQLRHDEYHPDSLLYVVGNEQNYHFDVLRIIMKKLGREWADRITHLSYGMVELPEGKMKSREGTVVDADELMEDMHQEARRMSSELDKMQGFSEEEASALYEMVGLGALKYFILKVDPKKNMLFNPEESIDFNGNTGPFIQYTHARIRSLLRKAVEKGFDGGKKAATASLHDKERGLLRILFEFPGTVREAAANYSPAMVANYVYLLAREYNQFYQEVPILREPDHDKVSLRLSLSEFTARVIKTSMSLLGIQVPDKM